jgi:saccharopine dehydrogenase (NAD+, L-lysine-forming)
MSFLLYGAYGYTGQLITELAVEHGHRPILAGRDSDKVATMADRFGLKKRVFSLDDPATVARALRGVDAVLHCAGPFVNTAEPMVDACLETGTDYLDITGEIEVFEALADRNDAAEEAGVTVLPGVGFDVVPTDCLSAHLARQVPNPVELDVAFMGLGQISRGTLKTAIQQMGSGGLVRREGRIVRVPPGWTTRTVNFGDRERTVVSIPWGDVATAYRSTGIPNITTYTYLPDTARTLLQLSRYLSWLLSWEPLQKLLAAFADRQPPGPTAEERRGGKTYVWASVRGEDGTEVTGRLHGPEGYTFTAHAALAAVQKALAHEAEPGYQTPSTAFGPDFVLDIDGVERTIDPVPARS